MKQWILEKEQYFNGLSLIKWARNKNKKTLIGVRHRKSFWKSENLNEEEGVKALLLAFKLLEQLVAPE